MKQSPLQRINRVMNFNYNRGICKESVVKVYRNILKIKYEKSNINNSNNFDRVCNG